MDIGKLRLQLGQSFDGMIERALQDIFVAFGSLRQEILGLPGFASIKCSAVVATGQAVNINNGELRLADAATSRPAIGICVNGAAIGQKARIVIGAGYASGLTGLTANSSVYLGNAGALVYVKPGAGMIQGLGFSLSTTEMFVTISQP